MTHPKPQEIGTGNYFKILTGIYVEITSVDRVGLIEYMEFGNPIEEYEDSTTALFPIELTEEWLVNLGFEKTGRNEYNNDVITYNLAYGAFIVVPVGIENGEFCMEHIKYVHQLQNLYFALTGKELTIKE